MNWLPTPPPNARPLTLIEHESARAKRDARDRSWVPRALEMHAEGEPYWIIALDCGVSDAAVGRAVARMRKGCEK